MERKIDRLDKYLKYKHLTTNKVSVLAGLTTGVISKSRDMNRDLSDNACEKLLAVLPDLNSDWLYNGDGEMLKKTEIHNTISNTGAFSTNTINGDLGTQLSELISEQKELRKDFMSLMNEKNKQINELIEIIKKDNGGI